MAESPFKPRSGAAGGGGGGGGGGEEGGGREGQGASEQPEPLPVMAASGAAAGTKPESIIGAFRVRMPIFRWRGWGLQRR